ncbi:TIGR01777 family protein [Bacillus sp. HMF5848]|uniref:TIGR01777 family oxidoreductase n=1 Tax=Bacillus sp. HMF5848 TaxID=2495421 RepID=UPI000F774278|nr:TIGR01777 family oxidoreductase [Bacillus sp. HMF5848]RSK26142.1 TIGR01777 family protein [Bacillus sp. HMF5848]
MKIAIAGGTGFVGNAVTQLLLAQNHEIIILTRHPRNSTQSGVSYVGWLKDEFQPEKELQNIDIMINLSGESLNDGRWTKEQKGRIVSSRLKSTNEIIRIMRTMPEPPKVLINASAIGIYGTTSAEKFTENSDHVGSDFLAQTVSQWEHAALQANDLNVRTVLMRFGVILGKDEGALPRMLLPYKLFAGGTIGSGEQVLSWIHIDDVARAIVFAIDHPLSGPVNVTAPTPKTMKEFGKTIAAVLHRPHWLPVPSFALKTLLGEMSVLVLEGQYVLPDKLQKNGFVFSFPILDEALHDILKS